MKVESDHHSKFSNLSNWKEEAWKISGLQRDPNPYNMNFIYISRNGFIWITNVIHKSFASTQVLGIQEDWIKSKLIKSKCWCSLSPWWTSQRSSTPTSTLYQVSLLVYHYQENPKDRKNWKLSIFSPNLIHILFPHQLRESQEHQNPNTWSFVETTNFGGRGEVKTETSLVYDRSTTFAKMLKIDREPVTTQIIYLLCNIR